MSILMADWGTPFIQVFLDTTGSASGATGMTLLMLVIATFACVGVLATNSRQLFAFSRDNGVPFSDTSSKVSSLQTFARLDNLTNISGLSHS